MPVQGSMIMKIQQNLFGRALIMLSGSLVLVYSGGVVMAKGGGGHQHSQMQGSGSKQGMPMIGDTGAGGAGGKKGGGMDGCNIDPETGWLGVEVINLDKNVHQGMDYGVEVRNVISGGPGEKAGMQAGDILLSLDGKLLKSVDQLENSVMGFPVGYNAEVSAKRGNQDIKMVLKVEKRKTTFGMSPMMGGGGGGRPGNMRPGMFMEDMMKRAPIGQMQQSGMTPGPSMMFGNGGLFGQRQESNRDEPPTETASARITHMHDIIDRYIFFEKELNLTSVQISALKKQKREIDKTFIRLDAAIKVAQIEIEEFLNDTQVDMDKVESKIREIEKYRTDRSLKQIRSLTEAKKILTKQQLEKFGTLTSSF